LVCPLDWGLGHATRCVPLIRQFIKEGHNVIIGADKNPLAFLKQEFPQLKTIVIPSYEIEYSETGSALKLFYESVKFYNFIKKEKQFIDAILLENEIDMIVSDNRYGLYNDKVKSIILTHQLYPKAPVGEKLLHQKIEKLLLNFNDIWIPDVEGENNLSGDLSHLKTIKHRHKFIGSLSRFNNSNQIIEAEYDICAIVSGPEPQRTIFEKLVLAQIEKYQLKSILVRGLPNDETINQEGVFNHLPTNKLQEYVLKSKLVVCRSGYSSIMDLAALNKEAILVPTPGQTEQEYLADHHHSKRNFTCQLQNKFDLGNI
jgi:UDP:flavonoid glycosyltransferase YjiC (YdhE family)